MELSDGKVFLQEIVRSPNGCRVRLTYEDGSAIEADLTNIKDVPSKTPSPAKGLDKAWGDLHVACLAAWRKINFPGKLDYQVTADMLADCSKPKKTPSPAKSLEAMDDGFVSRKSICEEYEHEAHDAKPLDYIAACGVASFPLPLEAVGWEYMSLSDSNVAAFEAAKAKVLVKFASVGVKVGPNKNGDVFECGEAASSPNNNETCTCSTFLLMAEGCKCGAIHKERANGQ